jgi:ketosteroid isomerase-like protein
MEPGPATASRRAVPSPAADLWVMNADGSGQRNLTRTRRERRLGGHLGAPAMNAILSHGDTVNGDSTMRYSLTSRRGVPVSAEENTSLVQSAYEAFGRGDMAALAEVMADDIEWVDPGDPDDDPNAGTFKGKEAVLGWFGGLASTRDYTTFEPREFIAQNDKVVSLVYAEATVRDTGRAFVNHEAHVWTFRDGKLARFQIYLDTAAAAAAHRVG